MPEEPTPTPAPTPTPTDAPAGGKTFTQEQLDKILTERLARERTGIDELKAKAAELDELKKASQTDLEKTAAERDEAKGKLTKTETENLRLRVAMERKLPAELMDRLQGGTKEEMEADADKLLELVKPTPGLDGGAREGAPAGSMDDLIRARARATRL